MPRTLQDVVDLARQLVNDTRETSYRHADSKFVGHINTAMSEAWRARPDLFLQEGENLWDENIPVFTVDNLGDNFPISEQYLSAVVDFVAGYVDAESDEFSTEGRAQLLLTRFSARLRGNTV